MVEKSIIIKLRFGLHLRVAGLIAKEARKYQSDILIIKNGIVGQAKSLISILFLTVAYGEKIIIRAEGPDEREAVKNLAKLICDLPEDF